MMTKGLKLLVKYTKKQISLMKDEALKALEARQEKLKKKRSTKLY